LRPRYLGTAFIATEESMAAPEYKRMLVQSSLDDVVLTSAFTGLPPACWRRRAGRGIEPDELDERITPEQAAERYGARGGGDNPNGGSICGARATRYPRCGSATGRRAGESARQ